MKGVAALQGCFEEQVVSNNASDFGGALGCMQWKAEDRKRVWQERRSCRSSAERTPLPFPPLDGWTVQVFQEQTLLSCTRVRMLEVGQEDTGAAPTHSSLKHPPWPHCAIRKPNQTIWAWPRNLTCCTTDAKLCYHCEGKGKHLLWLGWQHRFCSCSWDALR